MKLVLYFLYLFVMLCNRAQSFKKANLIWLSESHHIGPEHREVLNLAIENVRQTGKHKPDIPYEPVGRIRDVAKAAEGENWYEITYQVPPLGNYCFARFNIKGAASWENVHFQDFRCLKKSDLGKHRYYIMP
uniref:Ras-GEF domain-containing family member 1C n=1 Tax=Lygus hesperus TaxID=30085 RepID=A0A0A9ZAY0_LYGHE